MARRPGAWLRTELGGLALLFVIGVAYRLSIYGGAAPHPEHLAAGKFPPGWFDLFSVGMALAVQVFGIGGAILLGGCQLLRGRASGAPAQRAPRQVPGTANRGHCRVVSSQC